MAGKVSLFCGGLACKRLGDLLARAAWNSQVAGVNSLSRLFGSPSRIPCL